MEKFAMRDLVDPHEIQCLNGIALRIAQNIGLGDDSANSEASPLESELRRRVWWALVGHDRRTGDMTGSTVTALRHGSDCKLPTNCNDADLHRRTTASSTSTKSTEMSFALAHLETTLVVVNSASHAKNQPDIQESGMSSQRHMSNSALIRTLGTNLPMHSFDDFHEYIRNKFLRHFSTQDPIEHFTLLIAEQNITRLRLIDYFMVKQRRGSPHDGAQPRNAIAADKALLDLAIQSVENDNRMQSDKSLRQFRWFATHYYPLQAYVFILAELEQCHHQNMLERAWQVISLSHELRGMEKKVMTPMHAALARRAVRAWDLYVERQSANDKRPPDTPRFISVFRDLCEPNFEQHVAPLALDMAAIEASWADLSDLQWDSVLQ